MYIWGRKILLSDVTHQLVPPEVAPPPARFSRKTLKDLGHHIAVYLGMGKSEQ